MSRLRPSRRAVLAAGFSATATLAGCSGDGGADGGGHSEGGDGSSDTTGGQNGGESTHATVQGIAVADSRGAEIPVQPPDTPALLDFWATWCAPCKPQMDVLRRVDRRYPDVHLLSITNEEDVEAIESFWRAHGGTWQVAMDPSLRTNERFGVRRIPTLLVLDEDGSVTWRHTGLAGFDQLRDALDQVTA